MHFKEIFSHLSGVSIPIFGFQWTPIASEIKIARDLIKELEDKRVLYRAFHVENSGHCVQSVLELRKTLNAFLLQIEGSTELLMQIKEMRKFCRDFCDIVGSDQFNKLPIPVQNSLFARELFRLRHNMGSYIGPIAVAYGLDVEDELASIIPFQHEIKRNFDDILAMANSSKNLPQTQSK